MGRTKSCAHLLLIAALSAALAVPAFAAQGGEALPQNPNDLVKKAVANELKTTSQKVYFMYRDTKRKKDGSIEVKEMLETPEVMLGRLVEINGKPLTAEQKKNEDARLNRLTADHDQLEKKKKEQQTDDARVRKMVGALGDAFIYTYAGEEQGKSGKIVVLKFKPNPNYDPPSRELQVYQGMEGTMKIAVPQYRMAQLDAHLFRDVNFGWGILGHLDSGGSFLIEQNEVADGMWDLTHMKLHFTGKALMFKTLNIQQDESTSDYQQVPAMTVAQGLDKLKQVEQQLASNANGGK